jgi:hypothetical protein
MCMVCVHAYAIIRTQRQRMTSVVAQWLLFVLYGAYSSGTPSPTHTYHSHTHTYIHTHTHTYIHTQYPPQAFRVFDESKDGHITAQNVRYILTKSAHPLTDDEVDVILEALTVDENDRVLYRDLAKVLAS